MLELNGVAFLASLCQAIASSSIFLFYEKIHFYPSCHFDFTLLYPEYMKVSIQLMRIFKFFIKLCQVMDTKKIDIVQYHPKSLRMDGDSHKLTLVVFCVRPQRETYDAILEAHLVLMEKVFGRGDIVLDG